MTATEDLLEIELCVQKTGPGTKAMGQTAATKHKKIEHKMQIEGQSLLFNSFAHVKSETIKHAVIVIAVVLMQKFCQQF